MSSKAELEKMTCADLRKRLKEQGLPTIGLKEALVQRLLSSSAATATPAPATGEEEEASAKRPRKEEEAAAAAEEAEAPAAKRALRSADPAIQAAKAAKRTWVHEGSLLVLDTAASAGANSGREVLCFDMDDTLIATKSGKTFAVGRSDWRWLYPSIPDKLRAAHAAGKKLVIFTNQAGIDGKGGYDVSKERMICGKIEDIIDELGVPVQAFIATTDDEFRKPATAMWDFMVRSFNGGVAPDLSKCTFVGDAAGRPACPAHGRPKKDFSCSDRKFAFNIGIAFATPEEFFKGEAPDPFEWDSADIASIPREGPICNGGVESLTSATQEMVILCGFPASGKSTFSKTYLVPKGYFWVNRDTLKTPARCLKAAEEALAAGKSVVVDNTNPSKGARAEYIAIARSHRVPVRCFWMQVDEKLAQHLNHFRERITKGASPHVPRIGYAMFKKNWQEPEISEGFTEIKKIFFVANNFPDEEAKKSFFQLA